MDTNEEERAKGKTIEVGRAHFETQTKRITILDAPGHEKYVPNMIQGACQADYGALVISARIDEFESGFVGGGQTREHAVLARSLGIEKIIVCINKMDDPSVNWSEDRYIQIKNILEPFLESIGYNIQRDIFWVPCSGLTGTNINEKSESICPWYKGPSFFQIIDSLELPQRYEDFVRVPIIDRMKAEVGVNFFGKIESGKLKRNQQVLIYPAGLKCNVADIYTIYDNEDQRLSYANAGENVRFKLTTASKTIQRGYVLCTPENPVPIVKRFEANMQILDHVEHKPIMSAGYQCILHVHTAMEECVISAMLFEVDIKTKKTKKITFAKDGQYVIVQIEVKHGVCMEVYKTLPYFGRFTLRDQSKTLAIGKVTKIIEGKEPEGESEEEHEEKKEEEEEAEEEAEEEEEAKEETGNAQDS